MAWFKLMVSTVPYLVHCSTSTLLRVWPLCPVQVVQCTERTLMIINQRCNKEPPVGASIYNQTLWKRQVLYRRMVFSSGALFLEYVYSKPISFSCFSLWKNQTSCGLFCSGRFQMLTPANKISDTFSRSTLIRVFYQALTPPIST